ncbi:MAG TPA: hypothetical protein VHB21_28015 [Minicystis sp.]|nr:hypothetical protein [Minicystis sp.]
MSAAVRIKGQSFVGFHRTLRALRGPEAMDRITPKLPADLAQAYRAREILPMGWYPIAWYAALHVAARAEFGAGISREVGKEAARQDVTSLYRFILKFFSPETLLAQSKRVFGLFCDGGRCTVEASRKGFARILYDGCPGANRGVWDNVLGGTEALVEVCGGRAVLAKIVAGGTDKDAEMTAEVTWLAS